MSEAPGAVNPINAQSLAAALPHLRRPFAPAAVKYKIQTNPKSDSGNATIVFYIDARLVGERLNAVCPDAWSHAFTALPGDGALLCTLTVFGQARPDVGFSKGSDDMAVKGRYSDALKRAGVHFGIGVSIYAMPQQWLKAPDIKKLQSGKWVITKSGDKTLLKAYETFLKTAPFGEVLDHGDSHAEAPDDDALEAVQETASAAPVAGTQPPTAAPEPEEVPAAERLISKEGVAALAGMYIANSRTLAEVENFLIAKGFEDVEALQTKSIEEAFGLLTADIGKQLHAWLKKTAASVGA